MKVSLHSVGKTEKRIIQVMNTTTKIRHMKKIKGISDETSEGPMASEPNVA